MGNGGGSSSSAPVGGADLSDLMGMSSAAPAPGGGDSAPLDTPAVLKAYAAACRSPKGVLYEDDKIQIGWMEHSPFDPATRLGVVGFFFGNKSGAPMQNFKVSLTAGGKMSIKLQEMDPNVQQQAKMGVQVRLEEPFAEGPVAAINFVANGQPVSLNIRVPLVVTKFAKPYGCQNAQQFGRLWGQGAATECQATFRTGRPLEQASLAGLLGNLKCGNMANMDPNPANLVAGTQLTTASGQQWCLIRLECAANKTQFRLSTRSMTKEFAQGVMTTIQQQLLSV